jgi:5-methylcytosine-specific restriction endonuclease McrA
MGVLSLSRLDAPIMVFTAISFTFLGRVVASRSRLMLGWRRGNARYRIRNAAAVRAKRKRQRERNGDRLRAMTRKTVRAWEQGHPVEYQTKRRRYFYRRRTARRFDDIDLKTFLMMASMATRLRCVWCGRNTTKAARHADHLIPLSRGGAHAAYNLRVACSTCNLSRRNRLPDEWFG